MLGPDKLDKMQIKLLIKSCIDASLMQKIKKASVKWDDKELSGVKQQIRINLRSQQNARCIYCRRIITKERRNTLEDIEHFLDKSKPKYTHLLLSCSNLSLACRPCNFQKSTQDMLASMNSPLPLPTSPGSYRWLHPYYDNFHCNIEINKGWIYSISKSAPQPMQAQALIKECKLDEIRTIESQSNIIKERIAKYTALVGVAIRKRQYLRAAKINDSCQLYQSQQWFNY